MPSPDVRILRITWISVVINTVLSGGKLVAGIVGNSQAVIADAVHSASDLVTDVMLLIGVRYWTRPSDRCHPYGHERIETLLTALLGVLLAATGFWLGYEAVATINEPHREAPAPVALVAALVSIVTKEALYHATVAVGHKARSPAVVANAWHHRSDAFSSIPAALAVGTAMLRPEWVLVDHVGAIVVCVFILQAAWRITLPAARQLADAAPPEELRQAISRAIEAFPQVRTAHALRSRYIGTGVAVDFHIQVNPDLTVREGHDIAAALKRELLSTFADVRDVVVHIEPVGGVVSQVLYPKADAGPRASA